MIDWSILPTPSTAHLPSRVVGLSFDDREVRAVEVRRTGSGSRPTVVGTGSVDLEPGIVDQGEIVSGESFSEALRQLWDEAGFGTRNVAIGIDGRTTVIRPAELPALEPAELATTAGYEIAEFLSYPLDDALVSTLEISRGEGEGGDVAQTITLATRQDGLVALHELVRNAGLRPVAIELVSSALVAAVEEPEPRQGVMVMVHVSRTVTLVLVSDEGGLTFSRAITAGVDVADTSLSDELEVELARLADYAGTDTPAGPTDAPPNPGVATVAEGVRRTLQYYATEVDSRPPHRLLLCGPQAGSRGLLEAIAESLPHAPVLRHEFSGLPDETEGVSSFDAAIAVALTACAGHGGNRHFDLTPRVVRQRRADRRRLAAGIAAAAVLTPLLLADAVGRRGEVADRALAADGVEASVEALRSELIDFEASRILVDDATRSTDRVNALLGQELAFPTALRRMAESMPEDTFLLSFRIGRTTAGEFPVGYTGEPPAATFSLTGVADDLDGVGRWMQEVEAVPVLDGLWMTQSTFGTYGPTEAEAAVFTIDGALTGPAEPPTDLEDDPSAGFDGGQPGRGGPR